MRTEKICTGEIVKRSHIVLREQLSLLFENITEGLTSQQINYLATIINGESSPTSVAVMNKYDISSSTSAIRSRETLIKKDILNKIGQEIHFQDPLYKFWLASKYFA